VLPIVAAACGVGAATSRGGPSAESPRAEATTGASPKKQRADAARIDAAINQAMTDLSIPGAIVGIWGPDGEYVRTFGVADKATKAPMQLDDYIRIGSITKTFTTGALLQLVDQGKVALDDPISKYIPGVPSGDKITLRRLAQMSSGLLTYDDSDAFVDAYLADPNRSYTPQEMLDFAKASPVKFPAGTQYDYSNTNTTLLGLVVEKVSGQKLPDFIKEHILVPLKMNHTSFPTTAAFPSPHPQGYTKIAGAERVATDWNPSWGWGAGNMVSNLDDMRTWAEELGTGTLLRPATQRERIDSNVPMSEDNSAFYGLGVYNDGGWIGHTGILFGYETLVVHLPESQTSLVFFVNTNSPTNVGVALATAITKVISPNHIFQ